ncbi:MAG: energy transducer TonB [Candidatus Omnitrophota bacterium]|nr:energy transducer TonB [Candidatus Omnitrophota bacterium]
MNVASERIRLKDTTCPLIRLDTARKRDRPLSFSLSLLLHILIFFLVGISLIKPAQFGVDEGMGSVEIDLVPALEEIAPQESVVPPMIVQSTGGAITETKPDYLKNPAPVYPESARRRGQEGLVLLSVAVDKNGLPQAVEIKKSSSFTLLDNAAVKSIRAWKFQPGRIGSLPVDSNVEIRVRFQLTSP